MHEQSDTVAVTNATGRTQYRNVYGPGVVQTPGVTAQPGQVLPPLFPYEHARYPTLPDALDAAQRRSDDFGRLVEAVLRRHADMDAARAAPGIVAMPTIP